MCSPARLAVYKTGNVSPMGAGLIYMRARARAMLRTYLIVIAHARCGINQFGICGRGKSL